MLARRRLAPTASLLALAVLAPCAGGGAAAATHPRAVARSYALAVPGSAQSDFTLTVLRFRGHPRALRLARAGPVGLNYLAAARLRGAAAALVLVADRRPAGSLAPDLASVALRARVRGGHGRPLPDSVRNVFSFPPGQPPGICSLPVSGALTGAALSELIPAPPLGSLSAPNALAAGWNVVCGRPADPAFRLALRGPECPAGAQCCPASAPPTPCCAAGSTPCCAAAGAAAATPGAFCCPPNAMCAPCPPCGRAIACALSAAAVVCPAARARRRAH